MTNLQLITSELIRHLERLSGNAKEIHWMTAFTMKSGVQKVLPFLKAASNQGSSIKLLTGDYLYITQPEALELLLKELPEAEIRLWKSGGASFHPKAYLFRGTENQHHLIVGSSNLSKSALTSGVEWNLLAPSQADDQAFEEAEDQFLKLFYHDSTISLNPETLAEYKQNHREANRQRPFSMAWSAEEETEMMLGPGEAQEIAEGGVDYETKSASAEPLQPRPAQQMALDALEATMDEEYDRAMVVLATGLGKTYLAAFFARKFKRVLFIAHREEILRQAKQSFMHVHSEKTAGFFNAAVKETEADFVFASVYTLGSRHNMERFSPDDFDLIVVDEFHHAAAPTYERVIEYFRPKFLLGITATPDRMDNKDVYAICGGNVAISIHFLEAIERGWLSPFRYYGVYDDTDYSQITWRGTRYDEEELLAMHLREDFAQKIFEGYMEHRQTRTIVFCSSVRQATFMNDYFRRQGIRSMVLHGTTPAEERRKATARLESGELEAIFTVDLFNEGVDIPKVDTLLFIRPTESLTIYTQQIGRGLRLADGKSHCTIIDFIGNYRNADVKLTVFDETGEYGEKRGRFAEPAVPEVCEFNLDLQVINLLKEMARKRAPRKDALIAAYFDLKRELGRRPEYLDFHLLADADSKAVKQEFGSYFGMLAHARELREEELQVWETYKDWFIEVEKTGMNKSYKMVVLLYMLSRGPENWTDPITPQEAAPFFHRYLTEKEYRRRADLSDKTGRRLIEYDEKRTADLIAKMPMTKWSGSEKEGKVLFEENRFSVQLPQPSGEQTVLLHGWTAQIADYRLHEYFERKTR
ncbi:type I restriction enzyme EcoKI subunit R [Bhargavaea cecembensis DSE10]|uniref:Type I restriction enzyme EcoKI subunit R n=1 Tax=Bhargavaea cecembensis DSE10 TaxID=1235279 RepID=M7NIZ4_9BACL|nr:DEAD/DEAH box helicase family protein [Bhargavaea cecembensis]EMR07207.1 type I restriction enzyme EcoKI subunit R [Bhargavaea cecembensis DSE10]